MKTHDSIADDLSNACRQNTYDSTAVFRSGAENGLTLKLVSGRGQSSVESPVTTLVYNYDEQSVSLSSFKVHESELTARVGPAGRGPRKLAVSETPIQSHDWITVNNTQLYLPDRKYRLQVVMHLRKPSFEDTSRSRSINVIIFHM